MGNEISLNITPEQAKEIPMVDLAFLVLKEANTPFYYRDLMAEIAKIKGFTEEQVMDVIAQLYTEINVDGRFACVGNNLWGLKRWYPVDNKTDETLGTAKRPRIINDDDDDLDEEEIFAEEEETYSDDEYDVYAEDQDEDILPEIDDDEDFYAAEELDEELEEPDADEPLDLDEELDEPAEEDPDDDTDK